MVFCRSIYVCMNHVSISILKLKLNPFRTAVPFWGQTTQISSSFSPKRDCGSTGVKGGSLSLFCRAPPVSKYSDGKGSSSQTKQMEPYYIVFYVLYSAFCLPVDIQHNQCPCRFFDPRDRDTRSVVTKTTTRDTAV